MLNVKLGPNLVTLAKHADTSLRLACMTTATTSSTYLLRVKTRDDRNGLFDYVARPCQAPPGPTSGVGIQAKDKTADDDGRAASGEDKPTTPAEDTAAPEPLKAEPAAESATTTADSDKGKKNEEGAAS